MIIDLTPVASLFDAGTVISGALAFFSGMAGVMVYFRLRSMRGEARDYRADDDVVEAVVLEYTRRLREYDRVIADLRTRVDIMELRAQAPHDVISHGAQPSPQSRQPQPHVTPVSEPAAVTQRAAVTERPDSQNGTTDYILKLLAERPRTSREVQHAVGRTREHTARLMKKLHDSGLVDRDAETKPFRYKITGSGLERLREKASELPAV